MAPIPNWYRWLLIIIPVIVVAVLTVATYQSPPTYYNVGMHYLVSQEPSVEAASADEQRYYNWLTSEYVVNGLTDWVKGSEFATAVSAELASSKAGTRMPYAANIWLITSVSSGLVNLTADFLDGADFFVLEVSSWRTDSVCT